MPALASLRRDAVSFNHHYTAANDCTPSRAALLTGLHAHQTGCLITGASTLQLGFPTWGTMLREHGYETYYYGKWHLTHGDNLWFDGVDASLEPYGFAGGTYPSPDGGPGQGWRVDPHIAAQFESWMAGAPAGRPWCTTVSFVNPHDIAWWYRFSERVPNEAAAPRMVSQMPANFETPAQLVARGKPRLQLSFQDTAASSFGAVPFEGPRATAAWLSFLDLYVKLLARVDREIGRVLRALARRPHIAANTVVLFTSDHGEYGGAHGLRGKGASAYEEAIRVPLYVRDPRGILTAAPARPRPQLTSSVDIAPLLLSIATGSEDWRREPHYAHLAGRHPLAPILADPAAPGRPYILHATDEIVTEFASTPYAADAPLHVIAMRTSRAKFATYSYWQPGSIAAARLGEEREFYDYSTHEGRLELENQAGASPYEDSMLRRMRRAIRDELHAPLPAHMGLAQERGLANYERVSGRAAVVAAAARRGRAHKLPHVFRASK
jgi:arylsulfatase A-like enzyme